VWYILTTIWLIRLCSNGEVQWGVIVKDDIVLQEDIKSLTCYIVEKHYEAFESVAYVQTFKNLKQRYEQHQDRLKDKTNLERSVKL